MITSDFGFVKKLVLVISLSALVLDTSLAHQKEMEMPQNEAKMHYLFGIFGFNYTDQNIAAFSINGQDGGGIDVSSPAAGGGKTACCVFFSKKSEWPVRVHIRWQSGGCEVFSKDHKHDHYKYYYKEKIVDVEKGMNVHPSDIAVHFFKDGSVRVILVDDLEFPLLRLPEERVVKWNFPECESA